MSGVERGLCAGVGLVARVRCRKVGFRTWLIAELNVLLGHFFVVCVLETQGSVPGGKCFRGVGREDRWTPWYMGGGGGLKVVWEIFLSTIPLVDPLLGARSAQKS